MAVEEPPPRGKRPTDDLRCPEPLDVARAYAEWLDHFEERLATRLPSRPADGTEPADGD